MPKSTRAARATASRRDGKRKPTQPGEILRGDVLPALQMTQTEFAKRLGVSRFTNNLSVRRANTGSNKKITDNVQNSNPLLILILLLSLMG